MRKLLHRRSRSDRRDTVAFPSASAGLPGGGPPAPATLASVRGTVIAVAQDARSVAWLAVDASGCRVRVRPLAGGAERDIRYARGCLPAERDLALAGGRAAWGGYEDVRCSETYAAVYATDGARARVVQEIPGDAATASRTVDWRATAARSSTRC